MTAPKTNHSDATRIIPRNNGSSDPLVIEATINAAQTIFGGADRDRTGGLLVANQALSQLSYSPL